jgi:hypothetical protein
MGMITFSIDAGAGGAASKNFNVTNANLGRLVAWAKDNLLPKEDLEADPPIPAPTNVEAIEAWAKFAMERTKEWILNYERKSAALDFPHT